MDRNKLFDALLSDAEPNKSKSIFERAEKLGECNDKNLVRTILDEMLEREWVENSGSIPNVRLTNKGFQMLKEHGSYSNFVKSEEDEQTLKKYGKYVNIGLALVTIACLIVGTYVAVLAHNLDVKNDEFQKVIKNQNEAIDALERDNNELRQMIEKNNPK